MGEGRLGNCRDWRGEGSEGETHVTYFWLLPSAHLGLVTGSVQGLTGGGGGGGGGGGRGVHDPHTVENRRGRPPELWIFHFFSVTFS